MVQFLCQITCTNLFRGKKIALFFMHFLKSPLCSPKCFIFFLFIYFYSRKPPTTTSPPESIKLNFTKKNRIVVWIFSLCCCIGTLIFSVESRNLHRNFIFFRENHATSTGKSLITKGMVDISGHHQNIAATTSFGGGKARSVGNFTNTITCNFT